MKYYIRDIEGITAKNEAFRLALYMAKYCQPVVMADCQAWRDQPEEG